MSRPVRIAMIVLAGAAMAGAASAETAAPSLPTSIVLTLKDHRFEPSSVTVPAGLRLRIQIVNQDATGDEFESEDLHVEKEVAPHARLVLQLGPLAAGTYAFKGDLYPSTATGVLVVVQR